jgi:hypothetical protein
MFAGQVLQGKVEDFGHTLGTDAWRSTFDVTNLTMHASPFH